MEISELQNYLLPEDKMMVAVKYEVTEDYVGKIARGVRTHQQILIDLEFLANQNIQMQIFKKKELGVTL